MKYLDQSDIALWAFAFSQTIEEAMLLSLKSGCIAGQLCKCIDAIALASDCIACYLHFAYFMTCP